MGETIEIRAADGPAEGYVARPDDGDHPGVLFLMDAIGLRPTIEQMADRIAGWGYVVLAPNLFYRSGRAADLAPTGDLREPGAREEFFQQAMPRVQGLTPDLSVPDLTAYLAALRGLHGVRPGPVGTTGYCMGARLSMIAGCLDPGVAAAGCFHGGRMATGDDTSPHLALPRSRAEFVFGHADQDSSMPPEDIARLEAALDDAGLTYTSDIYVGAQHGYTMADTPAFDHDAAERHFAALEDLLGRTLHGA